MKRFKICIISLVLIASFVLCGFGINKKEKNINVFEGIVRDINHDSYCRVPKYIIQSDNGIRMLFYGDQNNSKTSKQYLTIVGDRVRIEYYNPDEMISFEILEMA